jgi:serine/threonine-protein kinase
MPTDSLDDLKLAWKELSQTLERQNALAFDQLKETKLARFRSGLRPLSIGQILQLILGAIVAGYAAHFWMAHLSVPQLFVSGLFLHIYGLMFVAFAVRDLILIRRIDYSAPVMTIQQQLAELRSWHIRAATWHGFAGAVIWLPVMLIVLHWMGADFLMNKPQKLYWLIASAVVCFAANYGVLLLARSPGKCGNALRSSWIGRSVNRAQETLDELEQFQRELN